MIKHKKVNLISALLLVLVVSICGAIFSIAPAKTHAEEIDYINRYYQDAPVDDRGYCIGVNEENVYKIHCPDVRESFTDNPYGDVTRIGFIDTDGGWIYFVKGIAYNYTAVGWKDSTLGIEVVSDFYDILQYDAENENVYIKFKNLDQLQDGRPKFVQGSLVNKIQYTSIKNKQVSADDVVVETLLKQGTDIYAFNVKVSMSLDVAYSIDNLTLKIEGSDGFLYESNIFLQGNVTVKESSVLEAVATVSSSLSYIDDNIVVKVSFNTNGQNHTIITPTFSLISLWDIARQNNAFGEILPEQLDLINKVLDAKVNGFNTRVLSSGFTDYLEKERVPIEVNFLIIKISPKSSVNFVIHSSFGVNVYSLYVTIINGFTHDFRLSDNEKHELWHYDIKEYINITVKDGFVYVGFSDQLYKKMPSGNVRLYFLEGMSDAQINTIIVKNDDALESEIARLQARVTELELALNEANATLIEKNAKINEYENEIARLKVELASANAEIVRLTALVNEYTARINELTLQLENAGADVENLTASIETLQEQLADAQAQIRALESTKKVYEANIQALTNELETLRKEYEDLKKAYDALVARLDGDTAELASLLVERNNRIKELEAKIEKLEKEKEELGKELEKDKGGFSFGCNSCNFGGPSGSGAGSADGTALFMAPFFIGMFMVIILKRSRYDKKKD